MKPGTPTAYYGRIGNLVGDCKAGVLLCQLSYWAGTFDNNPKGEMNDWFWKSQEELQEETALTRREQETARRRLVKLGVLEERKGARPGDGRCVLWFKVDKDRLFDLYNEQYPVDVKDSPEVAREVVVEAVVEQAEAIRTENPEIISEKADLHEHAQKVVTEYMQCDRTSQVRNLSTQQRLNRACQWFSKRYGSTENPSYLLADLQYHFLAEGLGVPATRTYEQLLGRFNFNRNLRNVFAELAAVGAKPAVYRDWLHERRRLSLPCAVNPAILHNFIAELTNPTLQEALC